MKQVASQVSFPEMEARVRERWRLDGTFQRLRERNEGGPAFSFIDGPMTANNPMGVHHAWGRTYKDVFQRYRAMEGFDQRYQNGFDCQGLWVEVEVEKELGLNSKRDIVDYGLAAFADRCRQRVLKYAGIQTDQSKALGQWMDWDASYYTMDNRNIEHIWHFLKVCHTKGWLYSGHRVMPWCCRCGTSLSQHELADSYKEVRHNSAYVRFQLTGTGSLGDSRALCTCGAPGAPGAPGTPGCAGVPSSLLVWTTTPWTLPANTGVAVHPDHNYVLVEARDGGSPMWVAEGSPYLQSSGASDGAGGNPPKVKVLARTTGSAMKGWHYRSPFSMNDEEAGRVVTWHEVDVAEGSGLVHIAPGCGQEDFTLGRVEGLPAPVPIDEFGYFVDGYGELTGKDVTSGAKAILESLAECGLLVSVVPLLHRYPVCWRCGEELVFRLVDEWFISCGEMRDPMREAASHVKWLPDHAGKRMDDWLVNMGDWCISRKRFWGMPLPFYPCACGRLTVVGSVAELAELHEGSTLANPVTQDSPGTHGSSGDLVNPSDLSNSGAFANPADIPQDLHRPAIDAVHIICPSCGRLVKRVEEVGDCWLDAGIVPFSTLDYLYDNGEGSHWARWFPAEFVCEMREQIRLWLYSMLFMSVTLTGRAPYRTVLVHEKVHDEKGRPMHKSWGNAIWFDDAVEKMGADVMRWLYASRNPSTVLNFGFAEGVKVRNKLMTVWNVYSFLATYASLDGWSPLIANHPDSFILTPHHSDAMPSASRLMDRWLVARTKQMAAAGQKALQNYDTAELVSELDAYIEDISNWYVRRSRRRFWKSEGDSDKIGGYSALHWALLTFCRAAAPLLPHLTDEMWENLSCGCDLPNSVHLSSYPHMAVDDDIVLCSMDLIRNIANQGLSVRNKEGIRTRQPLRRLRVYLPSKLFAVWPDGAEDILADELNVKAVECEAVEGLDDISVELDTEIDDGLMWEGVARDLVRHIQAARKAAGLAVAEHMALSVSVDAAAVEGLSGHLEYIARETLANELTLTVLCDEDCGCDAAMEAEGQSGIAAQAVRCGGVRMLLTLARV